MSETSLLDLVSRGKIEKWDTERVYRLPANELRIILDGDIHLSSDETVLMLGRGNFIGEVGLLELALGPELDFLEARSNGGCDCLVLLPHEINGWLRRHPKLEAPFYKHLSQELLNRCRAIEAERRKAA